MESSVGNVGKTRPARTFSGSSWVNPTNNSVNHCKPYKQLRILSRGHEKMTRFLETTHLAGMCKMKKEIHLGAFRKKKKMRDKNLNTEQGCVSCLEESKPYIYKDLLGTPFVHFKVVGKRVVTIIFFFWSVILTGELQHLVSALIMGSHHISFKGNSYIELLVPR